MSAETERMPAPAPRASKEERAVAPKARPATLAVLERSGFVESAHLGSAVVLDTEGEVQRLLGVPHVPIFPRSCLKPFQALAAATSGATFDEEEFVVTSASHVGTDAHVALVRRILSKVGLDESALQCPAALPSDVETRDRLIREGRNPSSIRMNCSGNHAGMLAACVASGWSTDDYLDPTHPIQTAGAEMLQRLTGGTIAATGVDGCGAPVFAVTLVELARGFRRITSASADSPFPLHRAAAALTAGIRRHPWIIDGPGQPNAVVIERLGVVAKTGAEGVLLLSAPDGTVAAIKVLDGSPRAATVVGLQLLVGAGALNAARVDAVLPELGLAVLGGDRQVGRIRAVV
jgi:L-asparaginase II